MCVLSLCSLLASGSDDVQVILWDPFLHRSKTIIRTGHQGNIFSVKVTLHNVQVFSLHCITLKY